MFTLWQTFGSLITFSCIVLENSSVHLENALSLTSMSAGTRNELSKRKRNKDVTASPYKRLTIKANNSRAMAIHNKTIQLRARAKE